MTEFLLALPVLLFSMVVHEYAHGYAALRQGDPTAYELGRLTLNPAKHIDPWMTVMLPLLLWFGSGGRFIFGGAKPVPVNPRNYRNYRRGDIIVSSAGILSNLALTVAFLLTSVVLGVLAQTLGGEQLLGVMQRMSFWGVWLNLLLAFFNLIPIPPLDGSHLFYHLLPPELGARYRQLSRYGFLILILLLVFFPRGLYLMLLPAFGLYDLAMSLSNPFWLQTPPLL